MAVMEVMRWLFASFFFASACDASGALKNVLMIIVDDLRPELGAYGAPAMLQGPGGASTTPHIDALAQSGVLFERAFVQQSICGPTRNSFLSGRYPAKTQAWNFDNSFRDAPGGQGWTALPEFFRQRGYFTTGGGKIYHPNLPPHNDNARSWSEPWDAAGAKLCNCPVDPAVPAKLHGEMWASCEGLGYDPACMDDDIVDVVSQKLRMAGNGTLGNGSQPFFIAAGLHKPHMPFYAPKRFYDLYPAPAAPDPLLPPAGSPYEAWHSCLGHAPGAQFSDWGNFTDIPNGMRWQTPMDGASAARLRRGYFAAVSYTDANVGAILGELEKTGKANETVVMLMGDHGWNLGEGNLWCKMSNTENGVRVPLIFRAPGQQQAPGLKLPQLAEAVDLYRTLADLAGLGSAGVEDSVDGVSLAPAIAGGAAAPALRQYAKSVYPRCYGDALNATANTSHFPFAPLDRVDCQDVPRELFSLMGYSVRTADWRYTEWRKWNGERLIAEWGLPPNATELYYHGSDTTHSTGPAQWKSELTNVVDDPANAAVLKQMQAHMLEAFEQH